MKSFLSLVAALAVVGGLAAGGYYLYQQVSGGGGSAGGSGGGHALTVSSESPSLALTNGTHYALTVDMRQGAELVHFQILPGHTETRSFAPGDYQVEGKISDPDTEPFSTQWSFQAGGQYNATFSRDNQGNTVGQLLLVNGGSSQSQQGQQKKSAAPPRPRP